MCSTFATSNPAMIMRWMRSSRGMVISTKSFSQLSGTRMDITLYSNHQGIRGVSLTPGSKTATRLAKLFQEAQVVTEEIANIVDAVFQHGNTLRPHAEGKAAKHLRVIATIAEHLGMHHTGSKNLQPPTVLADRAALAAADDAVHIDLDAGLSKGEMAAAKAHLAILTKHTAGKIDQHTFQSCHGDVRTYRQALNLMEHDLGAGRDRLVTVTHARQNDPNGLRMVCLHGTNLPRRGMSAQHHPLVDVEGIPHVTCRMVGWHIQQFKVVQIALDLAAVKDLKPHIAKNHDNFPQRLGAGMYSPQAPRRTLWRHIGTLLREQAGALSLLEHCHPRLKPLFQGRLHLVRDLANQRALL